ncbi:MAG: sigma-70 family RNA polymerase sigma factor [Gemmatimonadetes bacterium]|nr:sigma-70 family RNA polymerase sigma factor [Gemmatimonadota bacterium]MCH8936121.1 sigma-70 family RNA polymerase sigma factor [Gemmatimonadota bacterium]
MPATGESRSDSSLIEAWRDGDERAATELVRRHAAPLARFLSAAGAGAGEDVEDLVQETFLRAFRRIETFRGVSSFRTWLMTIGSNLLKDSWRRRSRRPEVSLEERDIVDEAGDPQDKVVAGDIAARIGAFVQTLPRMQRDVFLLRAQQGVEYEEIASALGTTAGAARVHYHHAIKRLKALLD